ncbi:MAG: hypothetical protein V2B15_05775 [Bacteroidota bacterium]
MAGLILIILIAGCVHSTAYKDHLSQITTVAEEEIFDMKASEITDRDIASASFGGHLFKAGMMVGGPHLFFGKSFPDCATVAVSGEDYAREIIIHYIEACAEPSGMVRSGTITLVMTDTILNKGAVCTATSKDFSFGKKDVEKTLVVTNEGVNEQGHWIMTFQSISATRFQNDGELISFNRDYSGQKEWLSGFETPDVEDDQFLLTGAGTILLNEEIMYHRKITEPLLMDRSCVFPLRGIIQINKDRDTLMINFGEGVCNNKAEARINGAYAELDLERGRIRNGFQKQQR